MKKRLLLWLMLLICLGLVGFVATLWLTMPSHRITKESFEKLKEEMTEREVEEILGVPAGDYEPATYERRIYPGHDLWMPSVPTEKKEWKGGGYVISIWFDDTGKVFYSQIRGESTETFLDKLRRFLHLTPSAHVS